MAEKVAEAADAVGITFGTFVKEEKANPYADTVAKLASLDDENASVTLTVDANRASAEQFAFQKAANAIGKTARVRHIDDTEATVVGKTERGKNKYKGVVAITFTLTTKHKGRRSKSE